MNQDSKLSRRTFLGGTAATVAALALPMNRRLMTSATPKGYAGDTLTLGLPITPETAKKSLSYLAAFEKSTGIKINWFTTNTATGTWVAVFEEIATRLAGGEPLDSAYIATEGMRLFEEKGVLDPLDSYIASDKAAVDEFYTDVNPTMLANFRQLDDLGGHTYFIPIGYNVMSIWWNRAMFKQYKVPDPGPGWTWDEFESAARKIANASEDRFGYAFTSPVPGPFIDVYPWVLTNGGRILNADQSKCVADSPECIEAAAFARSLVANKLVNPPGGAYDPFSATAANKLGMVGCGIWGNVDIPLPPAQIIKDFAIVPWPKKTTNGTPVGVGGFPMFSSSSAKPALWEFIKYSFSEEFQFGAVVDFGGDMPIRTSAATSKTFLAQFPPGTENFSTELSYSTMIIGVPNADAVESEISTVWAQILAGSISPAAGMKAMQTSCTKLMAQQV